MIRDLQGKNVINVINFNNDIAQGKAEKKCLLLYY